MRLLSTGVTGLDKLLNGDILKDSKLQFNLV